MNNNYQTILQVHTKDVKSLEDEWLCPGETEVLREANLKQQKVA